ncbi:MAG: HD domain-containing phosphohydrolase [Bacillota bacterium]
MKKSQNYQIEIPDRVTAKWQEIVDILADMVEVPAALVMRADHPEIEVFKASQTGANPYTPGDKENMEGLYCEHVIRTNQQLKIPDARKDPEWDDNPDLELDMVSYLGLPLNWPDGRPFGTVCVLDRQEHDYSEKAQKLLHQFQELLQAHLEIIYKNQMLNSTQRDLKERVKELSCLYQISNLTTKSELSREEMLGHITDILAAHLLYPDQAVARIIYRDQEYKIKPFPETGPRLQQTFQTTTGSQGRVEAAYPDTRYDFLPEEADLLIAVARLVGNILNKKETREALVRTRNELFTTLYSIGDGVITTDLNGEIQMMNPVAEEMTGWSFAEAENKRLNEVFTIINEQTGRPVENPVERVLESGEIVGLANDTALIAKDGSRLQIADSAAPIRDFKGKMNGVVLVFSDVTQEYEYKRQLRQSEQQIREEKKWLDSLFHNNTLPLVMIDEEHSVKDCNQKFEELFLYQLPEIEGLKLDEVLERGKEGSADQELTERMLQGEAVEAEATRYDREGNPYECMIRGIPVLVDGEVVGGYGMYIDITERKRHQERIEYMSFHDTLTGLYNRTFLEEELKRLNTSRQLPLSIIMVDVNGLKIINDSYGHKLGDKLLLKTAEILEGTFRQEDIISRWGGDEFVILLPNTSEPEAETIYERIKEGDFALETDQGEEIPISIAVGISVKTTTDEKIYNVLQRAEDRMYKDKLLKNQSNKSHIVDTLLKTLAEKSQETEAHVRRMNDLARALGEELALPRSEQEKLSLLASLHDIGKTIIPEAILNKPGRLNDDEWAEIVRHPGTGFRICSATEEFTHIAQEILCHHERWDGGGYPRGIAGDEIPLLARIISIVDAYDVMTNDRPYQAALTQAEALEEIERCAGSQFDPDLAEKFVQIIKTTEIDKRKGEAS